MVVQMLSRILHSLKLSILQYLLPPPPAVAGDLNGDGHINLADYNLLVSGYGTKYTLADYNQLVANYGK